MKILFLETDMFGVRSIRQHRILFLVIIGITAISLSVYLLILNHFDNPKSEWGYYPDESIFSASESVVIQNRTYSLDTYLWYDYMPPVESEHPPLYVAVEVMVGDNLTFPESLDATRVWLDNGNVIISRALPEEGYILQNSLRKVVHDGPESGIGPKIDVYIQLVYNYSDIYYVVNYNNSIHFTF